MSGRVPAPTLRNVITGLMVMMRYPPDLRGDEWGAESLARGAELGFPCPPLAGSVVALPALGAELLAHFHQCEAEQVQPQPVGW